MTNTSVWPIDATKPDHNGLGIDGNERVHCIHKARALPLDYLVSYIGRSLEESYPSVGKQSVFYSSNRLGNDLIGTSAYSMTWA